MSKVKHGLGIVYVYDEGVLVPVKLQMEGQTIRTEFASSQEKIEILQDMIQRIKALELKEGF